MADVILFQKMSRIAPLFLALIITGGGWLTVPVTAVQTGRDSSSISWVAKNRSTGAHADNLGSESTDRHSQLFFSPIAFPVGTRAQFLRSSLYKSPELFSRPADRPPAFRLGQRPPPHIA